VLQPRRTPTALLSAALISTSVLIAAVPQAVGHAAPAIPNGGTIIAAEADTPNELNPYLNQQLSTVDIDSAVFDGLVKVGDKEVKLSPKEYELLRVLVQHAGKVLTHKFLLGELWDDLTDAQYLRVYVRQLRQKIEVDPERPQFVLTETGIGYRLRVPDEIAKSSPPPGT